MDLYCFNILLMHFFLALSKSVLISFSLLFSHKVFMLSLSQIFFISSSYSFIIFSADFSYFLDIFSTVVYDLRAFVFLLSIVLIAKSANLNLRMKSLRKVIVFVLVSKISLISSISFVPEDNMSLSGDSFSSEANDSVSTVYSPIIYCGYTSSIVPFILDFKGYPSE